MHIFVDIYLDYQKHNDDTLVNVNTTTNLIQFSYQWCQSSVNAGCGF